MKLLVTIGDCNGIGIEIMLKSITEFFSDDKFDDVDIDIVGRLDVILEYAAAIDFPLLVEDGSIIIQDRKCNVIECRTKPNVSFAQDSAVNKDAGSLAVEAIEKGVELTLAGDYDALVTMPVSKYSLYMAGWNYPGHTEMLAETCGRDGSHLMILLNDIMRVALVTIHIPVSQIHRTISQELIIDKAELFSASLVRDFGIAKPRIAVLGLNPHAGEDGSIGSEEKDVIIPAVNELIRLGIDAHGPFPADGFFAYDDFRNYDGILAMYHDQGLIPLKLLANGGGVNFTAGLEIVRTSPDHGTAFAVAGKNSANTKSAFDALVFAVDVVRRRLFT